MSNVVMVTTAVCMCTGILCTCNVHLDLLFTTHMERLTPWDGCIFHIHNLDWYHLDTWAAQGVKGHLVMLGNTLYFLGTALGSLQRNREISHVHPSVAPTYGLHYQWQHWLLFWFGCVLCNCHIISTGKCLCSMLPSQGRPAGMKGHPWGAASQGPVCPRLVFGGVGCRFLDRP